MISGVVMTGTPARQSRTHRGRPHRLRRRLAAARKINAHADTTVRPAERSRIRPPQARQARRSVLSPRNQRAAQVRRGRRSRCRRNTTATEQVLCASTAQDDRVLPGVPRRYPGRPEQLLRFTAPGHSHTAARRLINQPSEGEVTRDTQPVHPPHSRLFDEHTAFPAALAAVV
jgi:hypothetical protein